jgi:hypothetical protein
VLLLLCQQAFGTWHANVLRQRFHSRAARLQEQLLCRHPDVQETMQQVHLLLSAHLSDGATANHSSLLLTGSECFCVNSSGSSSSEASCSGCGAMQQVSAAGSLQTVQEELQRQPSSCKSLSCIASGANGSATGAGAAAAAELSMALSANASSTPAAATVSDMNVTLPPTMPGDAAAAAAAEVTGDAASSAVAAAPASLQAQQAAVTAAPAVEAVWTKSAASGRWQLKHSSRQRSGSLQLMPRAAQAVRQQQQLQLPALHVALDAAAACTATASLTHLGTTGNGGCSSSSSSSNASTLLAGIKAAKEAELVSARGRLLGLLCSAVTSEVRFV